MVNEFKLAIIHFARSNLVQAVHEHGLTAGPKTVKNLDQAPRPSWAAGRRSVTGRGPLGRGPVFSKTHDEPAVQCF